MSVFIVFGRNRVLAPHDVRDDIEAPVGGAGEVAVPPGAPEADGAASSTSPGEFRRVVHGMSLRAWVAADVLCVAVGIMTMVRLHDFAQFGVCGMYVCFGSVLAVYDFATSRMPQLLLTSWSAVVVTDGALSAYLMGDMAPAERALLATVAVAALFAVPWRLGQASRDAVQFIATTAFALGFRGWPEALQGLFLGMVLTLAWVLVLRVRGRLGERPLWQPVDAGLFVFLGAVLVLLR